MEGEGANLPTAKTNFPVHGKSIANRNALALVGLGHVELEGKRLGYLFSDLVDWRAVFPVRRNDGDVAERKRIEGRLVLCGHRLHFLADLDHPRRRLGAVGPNAGWPQVGLFAGFSRPRQIFS